jgi:maltose/moltooligosaccharide transporter
MNPVPPLNLPVSTSAADQRFSVGTLRYTAFGVAALFFWLLWGDFIWTLMDQAVPGILPLKLQAMGAGDTVNQLLNRSLSSAAIFLLAPVAGVISDRHRGPRGRRIPFLLWSTPFVGLTMILMGCHESLTHLFMGDLKQVALPLGFWHPVASRRAVSLWIFGVVYVGYDFANVFVNTLYWYLFNDVVPLRLMSRFLALFRIVGGAAGMLYNGFVIEHALDHFRLIFVIAGIAYVIGFMLMCVFVREGQYPPPEVIAGPRGSLFFASFRLIGVYLRECFTHRFYWYFFLMNAFDALAFQVGNFASLRNVNSLHLSLKQLGTVGFYTAPIAIALQFPAGWIADKYGPIRVFVFSKWMALFGFLLQLVWIFKDFGARGNLGLIYLIAFGFLPFGLLADAATLPMYMKLLPRDRYGQFCSANAMFRSLVTIAGSLVAGAFMDYLATRETVKFWHYRYFPVWIVGFEIPTLLFMMLLFKRWKALGGERDFQAT